MDLKTWAENEVELACKNENPDRKKGEWDYGCACYESALKAFNSLLEDGHSGYSISVTKHILNRLIDGKPLTPITKEDEFICVFDNSKNKIKTYRCQRMSGLFKDVYEDGKIEYNDVNRSYCVDINKPDITFHNGFVNRILNQMFPITLPYMPPNNSYKIYVEEFLYDENNGDYDTLGILYILNPNGEKAEVNRYFKESEDGFREISSKQYFERKGARK